MIEQLLIFGLLLFVTVLGQEFSVSNVSPPHGSTVASRLGPTDLSFTCDVSSETAQVLTAWFLRLPGQQALTAVIATEEPGISISGTPRNSTIFPNYNNHLHISELSVQLDGAELICGHGNQLYNRLASWTLRTYSPPLLSSGSIIAISETESNVEIDIQDSPLAFPTPTSYQWSRDGSALSSDSRINFSYGLVLFSSLRRSDSGTYGLSASNSDTEGGLIGSDQGDFTLAILYGPELRRGPDSFVVLAGEPVTLVCGTELQANPPATTQWTANRGEQINHGGRYSVSNGALSLGISQVEQEDSGVWSCHISVEADNALTVNSSGLLAPREDSLIGQLRVQVSLVVVAAPSQPTLVEIRSSLLHPTNSTLSWRAPVDTGSPGVAEYYITADDRQGPPITGRTGSNVTSGVVEGLSPGTSYWFTVEAVARVDSVEALGPPSSPYQADTPTTIPAIECTSTESVGGMVMVNWRLAHTGGLPLTNVTLTCCERAPVALPLALPTTSLSELPSGQSYSISLSASNSLGSATAVCPLVHHTIGVPSGPALTASVLDVSTVVLSMSCRSYGVTPQSPFYYDLYISSSEGSAKSVTVGVLGGGSTQHTLSALEKGNYLFNLACRNVYGSSPMISLDPVHLNGTVSAVPLDLVVGAMVGAVVLLITLIVLAAVLVACVVKRHKGGQYNVHSLHNSPNHDTLHSGFRGVRVEEIPVDCLLAHTNGKELHYADLGSFQTKDEKESESIPEPLRVTYSTIDLIKSAANKTIIDQ